jgi:antitoxin component YwqK of YwqJK toxin-antitoxin module
MRLIILVLTLFAFSSIGLAQDTIQTSDYLRKEDKVYYNDSLFTGIAIEKADNGQIINEEHYENGIPQGKWREWYDTGETKFIGAFKNGINDGVWTQWYRDGKVQRKLTFKNGQLVPNEEE